MVLNKKLFSQAQQIQHVQHVQSFYKVYREGHKGGLCPANLEAVYFADNANIGKENQY